MPREWWSWLVPEYERMLSRETLVILSHQNFIEPTYYWLTFLFFYMIEHAQRGKRAGKAMRRLAMTLCLESKKITTYSSSTKWKKPGQIEPLTYKAKSYNNKSPSDPADFLFFEMSIFRAGNWKNTHHRNLSAHANTNNWPKFGIKKCDVVP